MSNENKSNYTAYNIYSRIKGEDTGEDAKKAPEATAKSIYAKNSNMFLKGVLCFINPLNFEFSAHPPARHKFSDLVVS